MTSRIAILLGAGANIGAATIQTFKSNGYKVAYASRSVSNSKASDNDPAIQCDLAKPTSVSSLFETVRKTWGEPSVVIYNAYSHHNTKPEDSLDVTTEDFAHDLAVNTTSAFVAAREALASFQKLDGPRTFIFTGNMLNEGPYPSLMTLGVGKAASAHFVELADQLYKSQNMRFHFVDERTSEGKGMFTGLGGQSHADLFLSLAERTTKEEIPWQATFVTGKGYTAFPHHLIL
ncbi:hypothetical protein M409DRAFT_26162 [Zasmidium cellare ATCC 36951]|uniref:Uncharacterized protein n=1 Tax=Zasmidium cellare ATCC 36951 TaxID=1080233 RepID=A0A6A6CCY1_ZASCE|nr:uncharacterized protein M409DRAFT_26162 [Zasmidium cellare ATCC 36951]KAF2163549.1 hypothetical protein M409DRAFT_26162 [Zasmidium cellare ATCC 36951]